MNKYAATALIAACWMALPAGAVQTTPATPPTRDLYGEPHYELVGKLIYGYQRLLSAMDDPAHTAPAPPELRAHFARVTTEYDAIVEEHGDVPDARLDAALREVQAVSAEMAAWKKGQTN